MNYTEPFLRKVETAQEEQHQHPQHQHQSGVSYRAAVAAKKKHMHLPKLESVSISVVSYRIQHSRLNKPNIEANTEMRIHST